MSSRIALLAAVFLVVFILIFPVTKVRSLISWHFKLFVFYEFIRISFFVLLIPMKRILQISMIVVVLMGTIGIPFYQHTCLHENRVLQSVFVPAHECSKEHVTVEKPGCCSAEKVQVVSPDQESVSDKCCLDEVSNWQFSFFFFQNVHPIFAESLEEISVLSFFSPFKILWENNDETFFSGSDPPTLSVLERLTHLCIWRL
jgi:hypothetical protein